MQIQLGSSAAARLSRPINGRGGFQHLLRKLRTQVDGDQLTVDQRDIERLRRYSYSYGPGGFQDRTSPSAQHVLDFDSEA
jgi:hypothetical protein